MAREAGLTVAKETDPDDGGLPLKKERRGSLHSFFSWMAGSFLLYVLGDPISEQVIDPLLAPVLEGGNEVVAWLFRPIAVLLIPLVVCAGVVVLAARAAADPVRWPKWLSSVAVALVVVFLGATLWSSLNGRPGFTHLATIALVMVSILFLERTSWARGGQKAGLPGMVLALAALQFGVSTAKASAGALDPSLPDAARVDIGSLFGLGTVCVIFGLAVLVDSRCLLTVTLAAAVVPVALWSSIGFLITDVPLKATGFALFAASLMAAIVALRHGFQQAPGIAGVLGGITGRAGVLSTLLTGFAAMFLAADALVGGQTVLVEYRFAYAAGCVIAGVAFWFWAGALITDQMPVTGVGSVLLGVAFIIFAAADASTAASEELDDSIYAVVPYIDWTLIASSEALIGAAFLVAGGGLLFRHFDRDERVQRFVIKALDSFGSR